MELDNDSRLVVRKLAAILRIADALDREQQSLVRLRLTCRFMVNSVTFTSRRISRPVLRSGTHNARPNFLRKSLDSSPVF